MNSVIVACMWQKHRVSWREKRDKIHSNFQSITFFMSQKLRFSIWAHCGYLRLGHLLQIGLLEISILLKLILCYTGFSALASKRCHLFEETQCSTWVNRSWYTHYLNATRGYTHYIYLSTTKLPVSTANRISLILCFKKKTTPSKCWLSQSHLFWHSESNCFVITTCHCCYRFVGENENWNQWILPYSNGKYLNYVLLKGK